MAEFTRARSDAQKEQRMDAIKRAADELFHERPYHEITLKAISERLGWSHAALYKYVTTKEVYPAGCSYSHAVLAEVWAEQLNVHRDYLAYSELLLSIIERNVTVERLAAFKRAYYDEQGALVERFCGNLGISADAAGKLFNAVLFHATSINAWNEDNPLVEEALKLAGISRCVPPLKEEMREFVGMCLEHYCR